MVWIMHNAQSISSSSLVELEKGVESENLMVNPAVKAVIDRYRNEGWQIAFISDMYLDSQFLREVLRREGCCCDGDLIYVSCECGVRKDLGTMYDFVRQELNPTEWKHWGDNRRSDVKIAKEKGVDATWVDTTYTDAECGDVLGGYQRAARIALGDNPFVRMAADFVAPAYVPYVLWLIAQRATDVSHGNYFSLTECTEPTELTNAARVEGKLACIMPCKEEEDEVNDADATPAILSPTDDTDNSDINSSSFSLIRSLATQEVARQINTDCDAPRKLYFLSRDSYVLMKGVEQLKDYFPDVELHYLFLSRRSLFLPYLACDVSAEQMLSVMDKKTIYGKKVDGLLALLATNRDELRQWDIEFDYNKIRNRADEADFLDKIFNGRYVSVLRERASEAKELLVKYFEQEGLLSGDSCDMVDVGWLGTSRLMVNKILDSVGAQRVRFFYYGVRGDVFGEECGEYASYFQAGELTTTATALIENYFSASPYPTTVGYAESSESVIPLFPDGEEFCDTEITKANCEVVALLTKWVCEAGFTEEKLRAWVCRQMQDIVALLKKIDLSPFEVTSDFDSDSFVRRMTMKELFHFVCLGANITAFDKASLCLSVGYRYINVLWRLHSWSGRFRRFLYLRLIHNK
ncbi:MAG: hypothetical protein IKY67_10790 [Paludibacteraceae bacterium]|nr:hypothetical protein [Paludibacteraceae bacterium]